MCAKQIIKAMHILIHTHFAKYWNCSCKDLSNKSYQTILLWWRYRSKCLPFCFRCIRNVSSVSHL